MLFFSGAIRPLVRDKRERLLLHIVFSFFKSLAYVIYLCTFIYLCTLFIYVLLFIYVRLELWNCWSLERRSLEAISPEVFCQTKCSYKFHNIYRKTPVPVSFLIKLQASGLPLYKTRDSGTGVFLWILWNF